MVAGGYHIEEPDDTQSIVEQEKDKYNGNRKIIPMNGNNKGTPTGDITTQFKWIPQSTEVGTNHGEYAGSKLEKLKSWLEALEEREAVDGRDQNRSRISRVSEKDVNVPILKSTEVEENRKWKKNLLWWSECTQIPKIIDMLD